MSDAYYNDEGELLPRLRVTPQPLNPPIDPMTGVPFQTPNLDTFDERYAPAAPTQLTPAQAYKMGGYADMQGYDFPTGPPPDYKAYDKLRADEERRAADPLNQYTLPNYALTEAGIDAPETEAPLGVSGEVGQEVAHATLPTSPLDIAAWAAMGGPLSKVASTGVKAGALALGGLFEAGDAQAGGGSIVRRIPKALREATKLGEQAGVQNWTLPRLQTGGMGTVLTPRLATPEEINRAARISGKGVTQPELRQLYADLGLTGGEPSELVQRSLAQTHPDAARQAAIDLKLADIEYTKNMTKEQRDAAIAAKQLPSQEANAPARAAYEPVRKEVLRAEEAFDAIPKAQQPQLFDVSTRTLSKVPDVPQFQLPRVAPGITERLATVPRGGLQRIERAAGLAPRENWGWYNLMQTRALMHAIHGPQKGEQVFNAWLDGVAGTSMVNPIDNNIRSSTYYLQQILQGNALPESISLKNPYSGKTVRTMVGAPEAGYGAKSQIQHSDRVREFLTNTYDPVLNPKPISYRMNLGGNWMPRTVDTHDIRNMVGMPLAENIFKEEGSLLPKEYAYLERFGQRAADRAKRTQAAQQAATWIGGGEYTNLKSIPMPFLQALNRRAQVTGMVRGQTAEQALYDAFTGKAKLLSLGGATVLSPAALRYANPNAMGGVADQGSYDNGT